MNIYIFKIKKYLKKYKFLLINLNVFYNKLMMEKILMICYIMFKITKMFLNTKKTMIKIFFKNIKIYYIMDFNTQKI